MGSSEEQEKGGGMWIKVGCMECGHRRDQAKDLLCAAGPSPGHFSHCCISHLRRHLVLE